MKNFTVEHEQLMKKSLRFLQSSNDSESEKYEKEDGEHKSNKHIGSTEVTVIVCVTALVATGLIVLVLWRVAICLINKRKRN